MKQEKREDLALALIYMAAMAILMIGLHMLSGLEVLEALGGGLLVVTMVTGIVCLTFRQVLIRRQEREKKRIREAEERMEGFKVYDMEGRIVEMEIPGTDLVEIRNILAKATERTYGRPRYSGGAR